MDVVVPVLDARRRVHLNGLGAVVLVLGLIMFVAEIFPLIIAIVNPKHNSWYMYTGFWYGFLTILTGAFNVHCAHVSSKEYPSTRSLTLAAALNIITAIVSAFVIASTIAHVHMTYGFYLFVSIDELAFAFFIIGICVAAAVYCFRIRNDAVRASAPVAEIIYSAELQEKPLFFEPV
ncbi:hypothetical protein RvY_03877 [Ramazzottius varieornatus]|uniref:MARVEL domain-containing protein n=1 Tax=Ramazzottius varieornatus TaxID=947166 RepID=A0A1D1UPM4_RAMVA|nr:hypothetical protein RvY_03877 [Ramazzottius varieornatus]